MRTPRRIQNYQAPERKPRPLAYEWELTAEQAARVREMYPKATIVPTSFGFHVEPRLTRLQRAWRLFR